MKQTVYSQVVSATATTTAATAGIKKSEVNKEIQRRHKNWQADNKDSGRDFVRVYKDWYEVYRRRPAADRLVMQSQVDKLDKMERYLAPVFVAGAYCCITTTDRSADAVRSKVSDKTGKTSYLAPIRWTVSALETAVKYCAKYYAGVEVDLEAKFDSIK